MMTIAATRTTVTAVRDVGKRSTSREPSVGVAAADSPCPRPRGNRIAY